METALDPAVPRHLFIVARDAPELANYLQQHFPQGPEAEVEVLLDRRQVERRRQGERQIRVINAVGDRRRAERRSRPEVDKEVRLTTYALVKLP